MRGESVESWGQALTFSGQPSYRAEPLLEWMDKEVMSDLTDTMEHSPTRFYFLFNLYSYLPCPPSIPGDLLSFLGKSSISPPQIHILTCLQVVSPLFLSLSCTHQSESQGPWLRAQHEGTFKKCINSQAITVIGSLSLCPHSLSEYLRVISDLSAFCLVFFENRGNVSWLRSYRWPPRFLNRSDK